MGWVRIMGASRAVFFVFFCSGYVFIWFPGAKKLELRCSIKISALSIVYRANYFPDLSNEANYDLSSLYFSLHPSLLFPHTHSLHKKFFISDAPRVSSIFEKGLTWKGKKIEIFPLESWCEPEVCGMTFRVIFLPGNNYEKDEIVVELSEYISCYYFSRHLFRIVIIIAPSTGGAIRDLLFRILDMHDMGWNWLLVGRCIWGGPMDRQGLPHDRAQSSAHGAYVRWCIPLITQYVSFCSRNSDILILNASYFQIVYQFFPSLLPKLCYDF